VILGYFISHLLSSAQLKLSNFQPPNGLRLSRCAERAKRAERSRLEALVMPNLILGLIRFWD